MPVIRIRKDLVVAIARDLEAFLRLDAGVWRRIPDVPEDATQGIGQRLRDSQRPEQKSAVEKRLARKVQQEREKREAAESRLKQFRNGAADPTVTEQTYALPEPDESMNRRQIFLSLVSPLKPGKMLDLATGPGTFSLAAAQLGWEVTAVDARTARIPDPHVERDPDRAELIRSVNWIEGDVREFPIHSGEYDLICIFGLLHHLGVHDQMELLGRCSNSLTLLNARITPEITVTEGSYEGRLYQEPGETREERNQITTASWGNEFSFHHTEESLLRLLQDCGYSKVLSMRPPHDLNYTFYLCLPSYSSKAGTRTGP